MKRRDFLLRSATALAAGVYAIKNLPLTAIGSVASGGVRKKTKRIIENPEYAKAEYEITFLSYDRFTVTQLPVPLRYRIGKSGGFELVPKIIEM